MSVLSELINGLKDAVQGETDSSSETETVIRPCSNCESDCCVYPDACAECKPYKEKLVDALYNVEHLEDFYGKYEVVSADAAPAGATVCPYCNAPVTGSVCEYCGSRIAESSGKIQVTSANDIPNPVIEARNLIYARREIVAKYIKNALSGSDEDDDGILGTIASVLTGKSDKASVIGLGSAMTEAEIEAMAKEYGVSVHDYLEGLDAGTYLSKTAYETKANATEYTSGDTVAGTAAGVAGVAGVAGIGSVLAGLFNRDSDDDRPAYRPDNGRPPEPPAHEQEDRESYGFSQGGNYAQTSNRPGRPEGNSFGGGSNGGYGRGEGNGFGGSHGGPGGNGRGNGGPGGHGGQGGPGGHGGHGGRR